jgi:hypothetical protein
MVGLIKESSLPDMPEDYQTLEQTEAPKVEEVKEQKQEPVQESKPEEIEVTVGDILINHSQVLSELELRLTKVEAELFRLRGN